MVMNGFKSDTSNAKVFVRLPKRNVAPAGNIERTYIYWESIIVNWKPPVLFYIAVEDVPIGKPICQVSTYEAEHFQNVCLSVQTVNYIAEWRLKALRTAWFKCVTKREDCMKCCPCNIMSIAQTCKALYTIKKKS
jgi:hypothetical protein